MADSHAIRHPIRRFRTRAALLSVGMVLGLTLAPRVVGATEPVPPPIDTGSQSVVPPGSVVDPASTTSTSSSTSTTTTTTSPPTPPVTSAVIPPLIDTGAPAEIGTALQVSRPLAVVRPSRRARATGPELPFTGNGTTTVLAAGLAALAIGVLALWWGSRTGSELDAPEPGATG